VIKVVIPEHIPSSNKGEEAILDGLLRALELCGEVSVTLFSPPDYHAINARNYAGKARVVSGLNLFESGAREPDQDRLKHYRTRLKLLLFAALARISPRVAGRLIRDDLLAAMADADLILAGHDGQLVPEQGCLLLAARIMGKPVALFGGGKTLDARLPGRTRWLLRYAVNHAILCTVRDEGSLRYLLANGVDPAKVHLFPDPAVLLRPCSKERVQEILKAEGIPDPSEKPMFGLIAGSGNTGPLLSFSKVTDAATKRGMRAEFWVNMLLHLIDTTDAHFVFLPHCIGPSSSNDDRRTARDIMAGLPRGNERVTAIETEYSAAELKGLIRACDFLVSERAHALIGAFSVGTPCLALTVKEDGRMHNIIEKMFGMRTFHLNDPDANALNALLLEEWNHRRDRARQMAPAVERILGQAWVAARMLQERTFAALDADS
jgi:polysaccharide pyruvyl transferase WcaK-like protein